jgi:hypothetical protein
MLYGIFGSGGGPVPISQRVRMEGQSAVWNVLQYIACLGLDTIEP